jgi:hypothetical protein
MHALVSLLRRQALCPACSYAICGVFFVVLAVRLPFENSGRLLGAPALQPAPRCVFKFLRNSLKVSLTGSQYR